MNFMERIHLAILRAKQIKEIDFKDVEAGTGIREDRIGAYIGDRHNLLESDIQKLIDFFEIEINIRFPVKKIEVEKWVHCE